MIKVISGDVWSIAAEKRILEAARNATVSVGIPAGVSYENGPKVEEVAFTQEFGNGNILPRPFVRNAKTEKAEEWKEKAAEELKSVVEGETGKNQNEALSAVGEKVKDDIVESLDKLIDPELKPSTVAAKKKKGRRNPRKPLIDSGKMRDSFKVEVSQGA